MKKFLNYCPCKVVAAIVVVIVVVFAGRYFMMRNEGFVGECGPVCADCLTKPGFMEANTSKCVECQRTCSTSTTPASGSNPSGVVQAVAQPLLQ